MTIRHGYMTVVFSPEMSHQSIQKIISDFSEKDGVLFIDTNCLGYLPGNANPNEEISSDEF